MSTYIVGDIQGCLKPLRCLLDQVNFDLTKDQLWSVGDIVNRGPDSLETLRFLKNLGNNFKMVLGNHDLHLLAIACGVKTPKKGDTLDEILIAPDREILLDWLRHQPLLLKEKNIVLVHAGIPPTWSIEKAMALAHEVERILRGDRCREFLQHMYGNEPDRWSDSLAGMDRLRVITNYLTRMRICKPDSTLLLHFKASPDQAPKEFYPWFDCYPEQKTREFEIFFGHWAALESKTYKKKFHALDSGCVWGGKLTLFRVDDGERLTCSCH